MLSNRTDLLNPTLAKVLKTFKLDKTFVRGKGNCLYDDQGNKYLDFIAQYGAVPFGYNPDFVWEALERVKYEQIPSLVQPSLPHEPLRLANRLADLTPGDICYATFCQSGAEAVEAAIKLARSATGKRTIISTYKSFHGKTLGALSATGREVYQTPFGAPAPGFTYVPFNDVDALAEVLAGNNDVAAFIVEPVQGEGGMIPAYPGYLKAVQKLCNEYGVAFIADEIQTGLGRTGYMFACEPEGVEPDVMLLAKALGGGMLPLGVCLSSPRFYNDDFGSLHSSTFANNNLTCAVGNAVLDQLLQNDGELIKRVKAKGEYLLSQVQLMAGKYPEVIKEVRGQGLMIGIEFHDLNDCGSFDMAYLVDQGGFTGLLAGYLLNVFNIRLAPFLNNPMTLRLEPPLTITEEEIDYVISALYSICEILKMKDYALLYAFLIGDNSKPENIIDWRPASRKIKPSRLETGEESTEKFAFIIHYPAPEDIVANNPSFSRFNQQQLYQFLEWQSLTSDPGVVCHMPALKSAAGKVAEGWLIGVPYGAREIMSLPREQVVDMIRKAVDMGKELGAKIVGLGALTSVVTRGGRSVTGKDVAITSGNSFTTLMAMEALFEGAKKMCINLEAARGAVVGATGSIGRACALILSEQVSGITLLGNPQHVVSSRNRLHSLSDDLFTYARMRMQKGKISGLAGWLHKTIRLLENNNTENNQQLLSRYNSSDDLSAQLVKDICTSLNIAFPLETSLDSDYSLPRCELIVAASNAPEYLVYKHHLSPGSVVCDVARPADVAPEVYQQRDDVLVLEGGLVQYPDDIAFGPNLGYRDGVSLACLSETALLALEGDYQDYSIGAKLPLDTVAYLRKLGEKHGLRLAGLVTGGKEITDEEIEKIYSNSIALKNADGM